MPSAFDRQISSFARWLNYQNKSQNTVTVYVSAANKLASWVAQEHEVTSWADVERAYIQDWMISVLQTNAPGYANHLFRAVQQFAKWYAAEYEAPNPMAGMTPPMLPEVPVPVLKDEQLKALLKSCDGKEFIQRRDLAIIYLFMDSGIRRGELAGLRVEDVDVDHRELTVLGKGRRPRTVAFGRKAAWALDRYIETRASHRQAELPNLWLGEKGRGPLLGRGIHDMIQRRGLALGIEGLHPHVLRHSWAHQMKVAGMADDEIMKLAGWRSPSMLARYAASTASERARESARRLAPGDRL